MIEAPKIHLRLTVTLEGFHYHYLLCKTPGHAANWTRSTPEILNVTCKSCLRLMFEFNMPISPDSQRMVQNRVLDEQRAARRRMRAD